ncbi:MAG: hypothetical protein PHQ12_11950 [Chthoniobacteraceae bacterium]|nr:hypothetical protein [Chthoniobacteraceae bacterium]
MSKKKNKGRGATIPLIIPPDMHDQIKSLTDKSGLNQADIMRLSIERGIKTVERMFDKIDLEAA